MLARIFVGVLLAMVATVILVAFTLLERSIVDKLNSFGLNTLIIRRTITSADDERTVYASNQERLAPLESGGRRITLRQLFLRGKSEFGRSLVVFSYPEGALPHLSKWTVPGEPLSYVTAEYPADTLLRVTLDEMSGLAVVRPPDEFFNTLGLEHILLVPQGWSPRAERMGYVETTFFERRPDALPLGHYISAVNQVFSLDNRPAPQIQSALPLLRELRELQGRQKQWRTLMAGVLGLALALVYGSIAVLEFRQNLFISSLLRSLGAPGRFLYFRQWIENSVVANGAALLAIGVVAIFHQEIFGTLGFPSRVLSLHNSNPYISWEIGLVLLWVNVGAFLSSLPVAVGLRRPVGTVLN